MKLKSDKIKASQKHWPLERLFYQVLMLIQANN